MKRHNMNYYYFPNDTVSVNRLSLTGHTADGFQLQETHTGTDVKKARCYHPSTTSAFTTSMPM